MSPAIAAGLMASASPQTAISLDNMMGRFTPASGDPRLIDRVQKISQKSRSEFRFTPAMASKENGNRALTIVVRAPTPAAAIRKQLERTAILASSESDAKPQIMAPVAYNLGSKVGIDRFAVTDRTKLDLAAMPKTKQAITPAAKPSRVDARMRVDSVEATSSDRPLDGDRAVEVDLTTSYKLTRNLKVTAGVRYKQDTDRMKPMTDTRRDSQAVYVGTQVRF